MAVAFSPDGTAILTGCADGTARLWDAATGKPLASPLHHQGKVRAVAFGPTGKTVLTGSEDHAARLWEVRPPQAPRWSWQLPAALGAMALSPDGRVALTTGKNGPRLWDATTGAPLGPPRKICTQDPDDSVPVVLHPEGRTVRIGPDGCTAQLWDVANLRPLSPPLQHPNRLNCVTWSHDGTRVLTSDTEGIIRLWDAATGKAQEPPLRHHGIAEALAFSPDGKTVLTGSLDHTARLWDAATGQPLALPLRHQEGVTAVAFRPNSRAVATGSGGTARLWDTASGQPLGPPLQHPYPVCGLAFSPDGKGILSVVDSRSGPAEKWWHEATADTTPAPAARYQAQLWDTPAPVAGTAERITLWAQVLSGMELDNGVAHVLDAPTWEERRQRLEQLGGPP
jgi:WD40 repeat protein